MRKAVNERREQLHADGRFTRLQINALASVGVALEQAREMLRRYHENLSPENWHKP